jgi:proteasome lid subunit RPN8/RPN11
MEAALLLLPDTELHMSARIWVGLCDQLFCRSEGRHESGAFLLGHAIGRRRCVEETVYYDDLDPGAYDSGVVVLGGESFGPLWQRCRLSGLEVVGDVHIHGGCARQSLADRENPMIAQKRHLAMILPGLARAPMRPETIGLYEYRGRHRWRDLGHARISRHLKIGI